MTSSFPDAAVRPVDARLVVQVPHWSAAVTLVDNDLKEVCDVGRIVADPAGTGRLEAVLPPGAYEARVTLDGKTQASWIVLEPGATKVMPASSWDELGIETAMPLAQPQPTAGADDSLAPDAAAASTAAPLQTERRCDAPDARLSIFATAVVPDGGVAADFDFDVRLLDEDGDLMADFAAPGSRPTVVPGRLWRCAFDLDPGYYVLRVRDGAGWRLQPLYLCAGMESHVFLRCDGPPQLGTLSLDMGRLGEGYDPEKDRVVAADAILTALRLSEADRLILGSERLNELLRGEDRNPWLAVLAAYALLPGHPGGDAGALFDEIRTFLRHGPLADHPDVIALLVDIVPPDRPLRYPPMLRAALQRLTAYCVDRAGTIAPGSPLDRLGNRLIADCPWTAWTESPPRVAADEEPAPAAAPAAVVAADAGLAPAPAPAAIPVQAPVAGRLRTWLDGGGLRSVFTSLLPSLASQRGAAKEEEALGAVSLPDPIRALVQAFPANAPVYPLADYARPGSVAVEEGATIAVHAALIEAAITGLPTPGISPPAEVQVSMHDEGAGLLDVSAEAVSRVSGVALDKVVRNFRRLKQADPAQAAAAIAGELRESLGTLIAAIEAKQIGADDDAPPLVPIEDKVERLQAESARLRAHAEAADKPIATRTRRVADRLSDTATRLLRHAYLVIIADGTGTLRYGNRLLRDRLVARGQAGRDALERLRGRLAAQTEPHALIAARDLSPTSPEGQAGVSVAVERTSVRGMDGSRQGYVYYLRDAAVRDLNRAAGQRIDAITSQITLQVSLIEFGTGENANRAIERLEALSDETAAMLS